MGCFSDKNILSNNISEIDIYENYPEPNNLTFDLIFYKLSWKNKPNISFFQKIDEETLDKNDVTNLLTLFQISQIEEIKLVPQLHEMKNVLFYVYCPKGVIITANMTKIDYIFKCHMNDLIKFYIVDISSIIMTGSEYNSIREIKNQSR